MKRTLALLWRFTKTSFLQQSAYRPSFLMAIIGKALRIGTLLVFFNALYLYTPILGEYSYQEVTVLVALYLTIEFLTVITFHRNLAYYLPAALRQGTFDLLLTKPVNTLFHTSFRVIDFMDLISFLPVIALWSYALKALPTIGWLNVFLMVFFLVLGYFFVFAFLLIFASTAFWTITATGVGRMFENLMRLARYPSGIFQGGFRVLFLYVLPVVAMTNVPAQALLGRAEAGIMVYLAVFTIALFFGAVWFWRFALRHYSSASS